MSPTLIAIDTAQTQNSVAVLHEQQIYFQSLDRNHPAAQQVLPALQALLRQANIQLYDCDAIAFSAGPGSFTGVRTACTVAKGLGFALNKPLLPINQLLALAEEARLQYQADQVWVGLDARLSEIYYAQYAWSENWRVVLEPAVAPPKDAKWSQAVSQITFCGNELMPYLDSLASVLTQTKEGIVELSANARTLIYLALSAWQRGEQKSALAAEPFYLRNKVAKTVEEQALK